MLRIVHLLNQRVQPHRKIFVLLSKCPFLISLFSSLLFCYQIKPILLFHFTNYISRCSWKPKQKISVSLWNRCYFGIISTLIIVFPFFQVCQNDLIELEKRYWSLKSFSQSGKFDLQTFSSQISPPLPKQFCEGKQILIIKYSLLNITQNCPGILGN